PWPLVSVVKWKKEKKGREGSREIAHGRLRAWPRAPDDAGAWGLQLCGSGCLFAGASVGVPQPSAPLETTTPYPGPLTSTTVERSTANVRLYKQARPQSDSEALLFETY